MSASMRVVAPFDDICEIREVIAVSPLPYVCTTTPDMPLAGNLDFSMIDEPSIDLIEVCTDEGKNPAKRGKDSNDSNAILRIAILLY
jgi:hypothetical protein